MWRKKCKLKWLLKVTKTSTSIDRCPCAKGRTQWLESYQGMVRVLLHAMKLRPNLLINSKTCTPKDQTIGAFHLLKIGTHSSSSSHGNLKSRLLEEKYGEPYMIWGTTSLLDLMDTPLNSSKSFGMFLSLILRGCFMTFLRMLSST